MSKEKILNDYGCPEVPFNENVTMYYPAILSAMEEYANLRIIEVLEEMETKFMNMFLTKGAKEIAFKIQELKFLQPNPDDITK